MVVVVGWVVMPSPISHAQDGGVLRVGERLLGYTATSVTLTLRLEMPDSWLETLTIEHDSTGRPRVQVLDANGLPATMFDHHQTPTQLQAVYWLPFPPYTLQVTLQGAYVIGWMSGDQLTEQRGVVGIGDPIEDTLPPDYGRAYVLEAPTRQTVTLALDSSDPATTLLMTPTGIVYRPLAANLSPTQSRTVYRLMEEGAIVSISHAGRYRLQLQGGIDTAAYKGSLQGSLSFEQMGIEYAAVELGGALAGQSATIQIDYEHTYRSQPLGSFNVYVFDASGVEIYGEGVQEGADYWCGTFRLAPNSSGPYYLTFLTEWGSYSLNLRLTTPQKSPDTQTPQNDGCPWGAG